MKRRILITLFMAIICVIAAFIMKQLFFSDETETTIKVGLLYDSDAATAYTSNFLRAQQAIEMEYGDRIEIVAQYNVREDEADAALDVLIAQGCDLIFGTSYGFGVTLKEYAAKYPEIEFCQATCADANVEPVLSNYHNFMGEIYEGRYISGVVAGMKLEELIENGSILPEQAKIGYVGAYPYAEVISGYTAFFMGVRSVVPEATMTVVYTNSWSNYSLEKKLAQELIADGCVIISQHSDTVGPAVACEETDSSVVVYHVGYNVNMTSVAPTTHLVSSRINWMPYVLGAVDAVLKGETIESNIEAHIHGNDAGAGFEAGWVEMLAINAVTVADGTEEKIEELKAGFKDGNITVFMGDYIGVNPYDELDTIDLKNGYKENENGSAPSFGYILSDVITIKE